MKERHRRILCAVCALIIWVSAIFPTSAFAEQAAQTLTEDDAVQMQRADEAVTTLTESEAYAGMDPAARQQAALEKLYTLAEEGLIQRRSIRVDEENEMVGFTYACGVWGGILLRNPDEENGTEAGLLPELSPQVLYGSSEFRQMENRPAGSAAKAVIYYAFDNTVNSSRYPYYTYMKSFWSAMGLETRLDTTVTIADLKKMDRYDLCILSAHGSYYTHTSGWLRKNIVTEPIILLSEESSLRKDLRYAVDLLRHRIIKVNGLYCVTADFFRSSYRRGQLSNTIVYSETCEFLGVDAEKDDSMAQALLAGGARAVVGFVNNVYTVYSRSMLWDTVNHLVLGESIEQALGHAKDTYGADDLIWYREQGGRRPHAAASYAVLYGDGNASLGVISAAAREALLEPAA